MAQFEFDHRYLSERFLDLYQKRSPLPVFAVEHGLDEDQLEKLRLYVSRQLGARPSLQNPWWLQNYFPLLVVATEVGYRYRGTGTDFWPILSAEVQAECGHSFRHGLSRLFEIGHRDHHLARPGNSIWERHFPHIAWPIRNACAPLELHRHLSLTLRQAIREGMSTEQSEELLTHVRDLAMRRESRRFESWLQARDLAQEVIRRLLVPEKGGWLFEGFVSRLNSDLKRDQHSRRAIDEARRKVKKTPQRLTTIPPARFVLELKEMIPTTLLVRGPALGRQEREAAISILGIPWDTLRAAQGRATIDLEQFLAGGELALGDTANMREGVLFRSDNEDRANSRASALLESLQPRASDFFLLRENERQAEATLPGDVVSRDARLIQILKAEASGEFRFRFLTAATDQAILKKHGYEVEGINPPFRVAGLRMPGSKLAFASGFPVLVHARDDTVVPMLDGSVYPMESTSFADGKWHFFLPDAGYHIVEEEGWEGSVEFAIVEPPDINPAAIEVSPQAPNLRDFENGILTIRATAPLPLEDLQLNLSLYFSSGEVIRAKSRINYIPTVVGGNAPVMQDLRKALTELANEPSDARLLIEMQGFAPFEVWLRPNDNDIHFDTEREIWVDKSEDRTWPSLIATASGPLPMSGTDQDADVVLYIPDASDHDALPVGFVTSGASSIRLGDVVGTPTYIPKVRREDTSGDEEFGSGNLIHAYLAWKLSEANGWVAHFRRSAVETDLERSVVSLFCGQEWAAVESDLDLSILTPHGALYRASSLCGLLSGGDLPNLREPGDRMFLRVRLSERFRRLDLDLQMAIEELNDDLAGDLDFAVNDAFEDLRKDLNKQGRDAFDEVDVYNSAEQWQEVLIAAADISFLQDFKRFILPEKRWQCLVNAWYDDISDDALVDLLVESHVDASRRSGYKWLGPAELRTMLQLWLSPNEVFRNEHWRATLAKGLSDRQTARAVRYVALRRKLAIFDLPEGALS